MLKSALCANWVSLLPQTFASLGLEGVIFSRYDPSPHLCRFFTDLQLMTYEEHSYVAFQGIRDDDGMNMKRAKRLDENGEEDAGARYRRLILEAAMEVSEGHCMVLTPEVTVGRKGGQEKQTK
ncbi:hypothetical protein MMC07_000814 [Pseudocyphellaria aurata]|nr:hypothetical protein [Pseudocyphellaria aurata]